MLTDSPVADALKARGIPFVFATGYGTAGLAAGYAGVPTLQKPFLRTDLEAAVARALGAPRQGRGTDFYRDRGEDRRLPLFSGSKSVNRLGRDP